MICRAHCTIDAHTYKPYTITCRSPHFHTWCFQSAQPDAKLKGETSSASQPFASHTQTYKGIELEQPERQLFFIRINSHRASHARYLVTRPLLVIGMPPPRPSISFHNLYIRLFVESCHYLHVRVFYTVFNITISSPARPTFVSASLSLPRPYTRLNILPKLTRTHARTYVSNPFSLTSRRNFLFPRHDDCHFSAVHIFDLIFRSNDDAR